MKRGTSRRWLFRARTGSTDANHAAIRDGLRKLGHWVQDLAGVGDGCPDLMVVAMRGDARTESAPVWLELKVGKGKLRASQLDWRARAEARGIRVATVRSLDEALRALEGR